jgi:hypothetical protein
VPATAAQQAAIDSAEAARVANDISRRTFSFQVIATIVGGGAGTYIMSTWRDEDKSERKRERERLDQYLRDDEALL